MKSPGQFVKDTDDALTLLDTTSPMPLAGGPIVTVPVPPTIPMALMALASCVKLVSSNDNCMGPVRAANVLVGIMAGIKSTVS